MAIQGSACVHPTGPGHAQHRALKLRCKRTPTVWLTQAIRPMQHSSSGRLWVGRLRPSPSLKQDLWDLFDR